MITVPNIVTTAVLRLEPDKDQFVILLKTMVLYNKVANDVSKIAKEKNIINSVKLQHEVYYKNKENYPELISQYNCNLIRQVIENIKSLKSK